MKIPKNTGVRITIHDNGKLSCRTFTEPEVKKPKLDRTPWKVKDPTWLAERERIFEFVAENYTLDPYCVAMSQGGLKRELQTLRNYFVFGKLGKGENARPGRLSYHPEPSIKLIEQWVEQGFWKTPRGTRGGDLQYLMQRTNITEYGAVGEREQEVLDVCLLGAREYTEDKVILAGQETYKLPFVDSIESRKHFIDRYINTWLSALNEPVTNPRNVITHLLPIFFTILWQRGDEWINLTGDRGASFKRRLYQLFTAVLHFYEPHTLADEVSVVKPWVEHFKQCYDKYGLPEAYDEFWQKAKAETEEFWLDEPLLPPLELLYPAYLNDEMYRTYVIHGEKATNLLFERVLTEFQRLNATNTIFDRDKVQIVEVSKLLHPEMIKRLGNRKNAKVLAYVFRLEASESYLATKKVNLAIDLLMPIAKNKLSEDTPSLLIIERPTEQFQLDRNRRYILQRRLVMRSIRKRSNLNLFRYEPFTQIYQLPAVEPSDYAAYKISMTEPFYNAAYYPLVTSSWALLDNDEYAFSPWKGKEALCLSED